MAPGSDDRYDLNPPIPTYDEAIAGGSWQRQDQPHSPIGDAAEGQSLLNNRHHLPSANNGGGRRPRGYRPPTVETDDEDSLLGSDSDSDSDSEAEHVQREMQEMDIDDSETRGGLRGRSSWGKRIGFSLPQWRWRWRWRLPQIRLGRTPAAPAGGDGANSSADEETPGQRFAFPTLGSAALFLIVGRVLAILLVLGFLYLLFVSDMFSNMARRMGSRMFDPASVRNHVKMSVDPRKIRDTLKHYTGYAHIAGTAGDFALAEDTETLFRRYGLEDVTLDEYQVYLNYPKADGRAVEIMGADGKPTWSAKLDEDEKGGEAAGRQSMAFHGHSKSGDVKGPLIYANYGSKGDFAQLKEKGIDTKGAIALVRYGGHPLDAALKVKEAELAGFAGCLIYSDPADDGFVKGATAPGGPFMPADGVHRTGVSLTSTLVGDPLTPGWGSKEGALRVPPSESLGLVKIPSLPLAWRDAQVLLQHLKDHGERVPSAWVGGVPDINQWWTGNASSPIVRIKNDQDEMEKKPIWNVYGRIVGIEQNEKKVIIGNHRDAWGFGGPDPNSGTAIMTEVIRIFGDLMLQEWRPLRTIEFMSWDGGAYNLIGSTEYVEQNDEDLRRDGLAYINIGAGVTGDSFHASGSPILNKAILEVLNDVRDPNFNDTTLRALWDDRQGQLEALAGGSDYLPFQDIVGTSSIDMRFSGRAFPAQSSYANFDWVEQVGDPGFVYHTLLTQAICLLILELADRPIMPFDLPHYASAMGGWIHDLEGWLRNQPAGKTLSVLPLRDAHHSILQSVHEFNKWELSWETSVISSNGFETAGLGRKRAEYNSRLARFESDLLDPIGIHGRAQFKHVLTAPSLESVYEEEFFPSIREAVTSGDATRANDTIARVADIMKKAASRLLE
ncbi:hypothetical protein B0T16DRAFT_430271 [Cercophora newfieldiana]|uniref:Uncharacterized protein n=1 Tax=Cercophora newfieldiana TaxID=92897 RepID=A0AA39Y2B3_9PEZI|nr:hypothetical protein B0T16DRAFT_430271 [Cercophora newfieldiana]